MTNNILEMFASIQGEGKYIGIPSLFIRFAKCNIQCLHCDTKYSWEEDGKYSVQNAIDFIKKNNDYNQIVITGGEPLLYQQDIILILSICTDKKFTIETNGTIIPTTKLQKLMKEKGLWSISPKLDYNDEIFLKIIDKFVDTNNKQFKIVIVNPSDLDKLHNLYKQIKDTRNKRNIILQPNGNRQDYGEACKEIAEFVIANKLTNIRILPQLHRLCWGQKRGI
jgi:7-carboxy-7-deazaguanine synthase